MSVVYQTCDVERVSVVYQTCDVERVSVVYQTCDVERAPIVSDLRRRKGTGSISAM